MIFWNSENWDRKQDKRPVTWTKVHPSRHVCYRSLDCLCV